MREKGEKYIASARNSLDLFEKVPTKYLKAEMEKIPWRFQAQLFFFFNHLTLYFHFLLFVFFILKKDKSATFQLEVFESMIDSVRCGFYAGKILRGVFSYFLPRIIYYERKRRVTFDPNSFIISVVASVSFSRVPHTCSVGTSVHLPHGKRAFYYVCYSASSICNL